MKDPDNKKHWLVDEDAAETVRRIFRMTMEGYGIEQIAAALERDHVLTPMHYWREKGQKRGGKITDEPYRWRHSTVSKILSLEEYCGDIINFKTYSKSFKIKRRYETLEENRAVFRDVNTPIIERATWEKVQEKTRKKARKKPRKNGEKNLFSGFLVCADCGHNMHFRLKNGTQYSYSCSNYKGDRGTCPTTHQIHVEFLEEILLKEIQRLTSYMSAYEKEFVEIVRGAVDKSSARSVSKKQKELSALSMRDKEIDKLYERLYEDNVAGKISDDRFIKMTGGYEAEQAGIAKRIKVLRSELQKVECHALSADSFLRIVRRYTSPEALTPRMLCELVQKIEVSHPVKVNGRYVQELTIHWNCVGVLHLPERKGLPETETVLQTRKGVA
ncbi:recombinase family protein, partial [Oscillospiraceae bacterium OttesenSCG-928-F05]|nr:recombinase family protein [Oscillospiraceae bacterium OttesenSCG-928-F05]